MSSFKKKEKPGAQDETNKAQFGHPELDAIFGNAIKRGTLILLEEDYPTSMYISLCRYFVGSGYHAGQKCAVYDTFPSRWPTMIPVTSTREEARSQEQQQKKQEVSKIAWRYDSMDIKVKEEAGLNSQGTRLDLSRSVQDEVAVLKQISPKNVNDFSSLRALFDDICNWMHESLSSENDTKLQKVCITNLLGNFSKLSPTKQELSSFAQALKTLSRASHLLLVFTIPPSLNETLKSILYLNFDIVLKIEPLFENTQFLDFSGLLHILKYPQINNFLNFKLHTLTWGLKASSKKRIEIENLYIQPPEQDNLQNNNVYAEENKTKTIICSNKPSGKTDLDF